MMAASETSDDTSKTEEGSLNVTCINLQSINASAKKFCVRFQSASTTSRCKQTTNTFHLLWLRVAEMTNCAFNSVCSQQCDELFENTPLSAASRRRLRAAVDGTHLHHLLCSSRATADPRSRRCSACSSGSPAPDEDQHSEEVVQVIAGSSPRSHNPLSQRNVNNGRFSTRLLCFMTVRCKHVFKNDSSNNFRNRCYRSFVLLSGLRLLSPLVETFYPPV